MLVVGFFVEKDIFENIFFLIYGVFKGGYVKIFGVQFLVCVFIIVWIVIIVFMQFYIIEKFVGLRFLFEEEIFGVDVCEYGIDQL